MRFRLHKGSLADSLATLREVAGPDEVIRLVLGYLEDASPFQKFTAQNISSEFYADDARAWGKTWLITANGWGPVGYTDGPL